MAAMTLDDYRAGCEGHADATPIGETTIAAAAPDASRRRLLAMGLGTALLAWSGRSALAQISLNPHAKQNEGRARAGGDALVVVFMRGAADGLSLVVPHGDDDYYRARPNIAIARPESGQSGGKKDNKAAGAALDLDGFFGLHPGLSPLLPLYKDGSLAIVHAVGSQDQTRSHFEAMLTMERGIASDRDAQGQSSGWVARHLAAAPVRDPSPLRAVAFGNVMPESLRGALDASVLSSLTDFKLALPPTAKGSAVAATLAALYAQGDDPVARAGRATLGVLDTLKQLDPAQYKSANNAAYPQSSLGDGLRQVACLLKARVGLEVACLSSEGPYLWDTHVAQNNIIGAQIGDVGDSLGAFAQDLGKSGLENVTVVAMTEFGRRVGENSGLGTDHGRASVLFTLGGGINGGRVYGKWPGLHDDQLEPPGDLRVTTDYRTVLAEIIARRLAASPAHVASIFPSAPTAYLGLAR